MENYCKKLYKNVPNNNTEKLEGQSTYIPTDDVGEIHVRTA